DHLAVGPGVRIAAVEEHDGPRRRFRPERRALPLDLRQREPLVPQLAGELAVGNRAATRLAGQHRLAFLRLGLHAFPPLAIPAGAGQPPREEPALELPVPPRDHLDAEFLVAGELPLILALDKEVRPGLLGVDGDVLDLGFRLALLGAKATRRYHRERKQEGTD